MLFVSKSIYQNCIAKDYPRNGGKIVEGIVKVAFIFSILSVITLLVYPKHDKSI